MTKPYWATQPTAFAYARLSPRQGDASIGALLGHFFPGAGFSQDAFALGLFTDNDPPAAVAAMSALDARYAPRPEDTYNMAPYVPWGLYESRTAANADFNARVLDPAPWRPMPDSRWVVEVDVGRRCAVCRGASLRSRVSSSGSSIDCCVHLLVESLRFGSIIDVATAGPGLTSMSNLFGVVSNNVYTSTGPKSGGRGRHASPSSSDFASIPPLDGYGSVGEFRCERSCAHEYQSAYALF